MQDADLLVQLAGIAGVFVGFGALIAVRGGSASDVFDVAYIGMVVWYAIMVVALALAPVAISRFAVTDHVLWVSCSVAFLALFWVGDWFMERISSERQTLKAAMPLKQRARYEIVGVFLWVPMNIALALILLGVRPDLDAALYFAALVLLLFLDAMLLLMAVVGAGRPQPT